MKKDKKKSGIVKWFVTSGVSLVLVIAMIVASVMTTESPVYVRYRIQDAWGWCTGMIQRDDMGW